MRVFTILLAFVMISCGGGVKKDLEKFVGQEVVLPDNMQVSMNGKDTLLVNDLNKDVKLVVWYDSTGCSSCRLKDLWQWEEYAKYANTVGINFFVVLSPSPNNIHSVDLAVRSQRTPFPVHKDYSQDLYRLNPAMPSNAALHTFLLDKDNKVVIVGSPLNNPKLAELYRSVVGSLMENNSTLQ